MPMPDQHNPFIFAEQALYVAHVVTSNTIVGADGEKRRGRRKRRQIMPNPGHIHVEQFVPHPPSRVWQAPSTPDFVAKWWAPGDIQPVVGHRFSLDMGAWGKQA
jgi:hypothetical protein